MSGVFVIKVVLDRGVAWGERSLSETAQYPVFFKVVLTVLTCGSKSCAP